MPRLTGYTAAGVAKLLPYMNNILGAVRAGGNVAGIWSAAREGAAGAGRTISGASIFDMNYMVGNARSIISAEAAYAAAAPTDAVTSEMWTWAPWADQSGPAWGEANYHLRVAYTAAGPDGSLYDVWGQTDFPGSIEGPKSRIEERALGMAQSALATGSERASEIIGDLAGATVVSINSVQILRV